MMNLTNELNRSRLNIARCDLENLELEHIVAFMIPVRLQLGIWQLLLEEMKVEKQQFYKH